MKSIFNFDFRVYKVERLKYFFLIKESDFLKLYMSWERDRGYCKKDYKHLT